MAITSYDLTNEKMLLKKHELKSPYLANDKVQLLSTLTEKRFVQKKALDYISSFPLAANIYKASSDDLKSFKRTNKKIKKSVLTLPNEPTHAPQICTASDMNDSEYYSQSNVNKPRIKKRTAIKNVRKPVYKSKEFLYYDRDDQYCSQYHVNLNSSSMDVFKNYRGDCRRVSNFTTQKNKENDDDEKPDGVWAVLRNLNRFPFQPSPPMSEESIPCAKKKKAKKKRVKAKNTRLFETCHTQEIAYRISYDIDGNSGSLTQSSSFDRITVIDKKDGFNKMCKDIEVRLTKRNSSHSNDSDNKTQLNAVAKTKKKAIKKRNVKALCGIVPKENNVELLQSNDNLHIKNQNVKQTDSALRNMVVPRKTESFVNTGSNNNNMNDVECNLDYANTEDSFIYSVHSGSSKAELQLATKASKLNKKNTFTGAPYAPQRKTTSSPTPSRQPEIKSGKPSLVTKLPSTCMIPKLTVTEIKRRMASMRYPIVILGKEQMSSLEVHDYDPPQFNGLDKHIWPFMEKWDQTNKSNEERVAGQNIDAKCKDYRLNRKKSNNFDLNSKAIKSSKPNNNDFTNCKSKIYDRDTKSLLYPEIKNKLRQCKNRKSLTLLKEKMLNLLYEKISNGYIINDNYDNNPIKPTYNMEHVERIINDNYDNNLLKPTYNKCPMEHVERPVNRKPIEKLDARPESEIKSTVILNNIPVRPSLHPSVKSPIMSPKSSPIISRNRSPDKSSVNRSKQKPRQNELSRSWTRAKKANNFIDTVINKIKSGVYFNQENLFISATDIAMQTDNLDLDDNSDLSPKVTIMKKQHLTCTIPGFDNTLPGVEIKTFNVNEIVIKHCVTNAMMQFDVTVPTEANNIVIDKKTSIPTSPIEVTKDHEKIFKCKTTLLNAMLPAELCSILPKLLELIDPDKSLRPLCSESISTTHSQLSTISEFSRKFSNASIPIVFEEPLQSSFSSFVQMSPVVKNLLRGMFSNTHKTMGETNSPTINYSGIHHGLLHKPLSKVYFAPTPMYIRIKSLIVSNLSQPNETLIMSNQQNLGLPDNLKNECIPSTALELYTTKNKRLVQPFRPYSFEDAIINIIYKTHILSLRCNITWNINVLKMQYDNMKNIDVCYTTIPDNEGIEKKMCVTIKDMKIDYLNSKDKMCDHMTIQRHSKKCIEYIKRSSNYNSENKDKQSSSEFRATNNKNKRKGFYRLYRKCKSASNIYVSSVEKCANTQLNKIQNLGDFFQILGSRKLSGVFDGYCERKLLSSVVEMKNWITDINPTQAMLLLLLTNKKDTPNLVRFRPILIQGIAVNRITRATELDMEIEVIERENLHKFSEYEGISYGPASVQNDNQLLEELYWIAKTTASDYQKPFDDSSERLLKSLLEKRKKLNPSYLRVMARYVGLGLVKPPPK